MAFELTFALATRVVLALSPLGSYIQDDNQLSSPLTSYSRRKHFTCVFDSTAVVHFSTIVPTSRIHPTLLWTLFDVIGAWALVNIWRSRSNVQKRERDMRIAAL